MRKVFLVLFLIFGFSTSAFSSGLYRMAGVPANLSGCSISGGMVATLEAFKSACSSFTDAGGWSYTFSHFTTRGSSKTANYNYDSGGKTGNTSIWTAYSVSECPSGEKFNELTQKCEVPDFCESSQFLSLVASESNACAAQYPNHFTDFSHSCVSSSNYSFTCKQGAPKPPTDGSGGDGSGSGGDGSGSGGDGSGSGGDGSGSGGDGSGSGGDGSGSGGDGSGSGGSGSGGDGSGSGGDGSGSGGDGSGSGGDGSGSGGGGSGSGGGGSGSGGGGSGGEGSGTVDLSGVITKINESNKLLKDLKTSSDSVGSAIGANGTKLDELGTKLDKLAEGSKTSASANNCQPNSFSCSGNAYECFIARQSWDNKCLIKSMTETEIDPTVETDAKRKITSSGDDLINSLENYNNEKLNPNLLSNGEQVLSDSLSKYDESNGFSFDDGCPSPINVAYGLGSFELNYQPFCDLALYIRAMLMLTASIASFLMIAKHS